MAAAAVRELRPTLIAENRSTPVADFRCDPGFCVEVKTVTRCFGAALMDEGITLIPSDVAVLKQRLASKCGQGREQAGPNGSVVLAVWCDVAGMVLAAAAESETVELGEAIGPNAVILAVTDVEGQDRFVPLAATDCDRGLDRLEARMRRRDLVLPQRINFSRHVSHVGGATEYFSIGRKVAMSDVGDFYFPDERGSGETAIAGLHRSIRNTFVFGVRQALSARAAWAAEIARRPLEQRTYEASEVNVDSRFIAHFQWFEHVWRCVTCLKTLELLDSVFPVGRPRDDIDCFFGAVRFQGGRRLLDLNVLGPPGRLLTRVTRQLGSTVGLGLE